MEADESLVLAQNHSKWQCAVCLDLLYNPVYCTKTCNKTTVLCEKCMDQALQNNSHRCPICNARLQGWNRNRESFYAKQLWHDIKTQLPGLCKLRASGQDVMDDLEDASEISRKASSLAKKGEIAEDLRKKQAKQDAQREKRERENDALFEAYLEANPEYGAEHGAEHGAHASHNAAGDVALAQRLQELEDKAVKQRRMQEAKDAAFALQLQRQFDAGQSEPDAVDLTHKAPKKRKWRAEGGASKRWKPKKSVRKGTISKWLQTPHKSSSTP